MDAIEKLAREHGTGGWQTLDDMVRFGKAVAEAERQACADCVPSNWCDPMLTGPDAVIGKVADCRPIEAVLRATKARIMERSNA